MKCNRSYGEKHGKNRRRRKIYEEQKKQGKDEIRKIILWLCIVWFIPLLLKVIWLSKKSFFLLNAEDEGSSFF